MIDVLTPILSLGARSVGQLLAASDELGVVDVQYHFTRPFVQPAPLWDYWAWLLVPLCLGIAIVYKCVRCNQMKRVPREALVLFVFILVVMVSAAGALAGLVRLMER